MTSRGALLLAVALFAAGCASLPPAPGTFTFGVLGDTPYSDAEEREFVAMIGRINAEPLAFVVHIGDFKGGGDCSDALYARRKAQFDAFTHPLVYTPGDNEWTDCRRGYMGSMDPLERLARLRQVFFAERFSLGARMPLEAEDQCLAPPVGGCGCGAYPENRAWEHGGVRFVTLNVPGSENNVGFDAASDAEAKCRDAANARWLERAARAAADEAVRGLVIAIQADPWDTRKPVYRGLLAQVEAVAARIRKPVLFIHGDTHVYRVDRPFAGPITRLETYGSPFVGWVKVTVDPRSADLFRFEPMLQRFVLPR
jgi:hypothetical protein